jgi:beta-glucosidase
MLAARKAAGTSRRGHVMRRPSSLWVPSVPLRICSVVLALAALIAASFFATNHIIRADSSRPWMNTSLSPDRRADLLIARMTLDEKIALLHGAPGSAYVGYVPANTRLGIPALYLEDGPAGVADGMTDVTELPAPVAGAASWDPSVMKKYGQVIGTEEAGKGANITLAPTINIVRDPRWGRAYESLGEDPYLTGQMAAAEIQGIQRQGEIAQVKHWAVYNQETNRNTPADDAIVSDRAMQEIYFPAFQDAIDLAHVGGVMCSYSTINGAYACQNPYLDQILRDQFHFPGFTTSDWSATHSTTLSATHGLDMQMPDGSYYGAALRAAVVSGHVSMATLNQHVHNILRTMFALRLFDHRRTGSPSATVTSPQHTQVALQTAEEGTVLLKNDSGILPFDTSKIHSIAVIGDDAGPDARTAGGGSASVDAPYVVTPYQGIANRAGSSVHVQYAPGVAADSQLPVVTSQYLKPALGGGDGLTAQFYNNMTLGGSSVLTRTNPNIDFTWNGGSPGNGVNATQWSAKWTGTLTPPATGSYTFSLASDGGTRLYINGQLIIDNWSDQAAHTETGAVSLTANKPAQIEVDYYHRDGESSLISLRGQISGDPSLLDRAVQLARASDVAVVFASDFEHEGADLTNIDLPAPQNQLIAAVAGANPDTIVVLNTGSAVTMPWVDSVKGILEEWYPGQEDGNASAAVLFGDVNPSGKLPVTFPRSLADVPASTPQQWPGVTGQVQYAEGLLVGYRWYDAKQIAPLFPFGYGLSYTTFSFGDLTVAPPLASSNSNITVDADVVNTGSRAGAEVVQLYLSDPAPAGEPPRQLKGFQKVMLQPGQTQHVHFTLDPRAFSYWNELANGWAVADGTYQVLVGDSSGNLPLQGSFQVR